MKFYNRQTELADLERGRILSESVASFTVLTGRRRIGKTMLVLESVKDQKYLYLFVSRKGESLLCAQFQEAAQAALGLRIYGELTEFAPFFEELLRFAETTPYTLIIDEFQDFERVNPSIFGEIQRLWDQYRDRSKINLIVSGSVYSLMMKIFEHGKEPLFGRKTAGLSLRPFTAAVIKEILSDYNPRYTPEDLLCLYMLSGGIPKYISLLLDRGAVTAKKMINQVTLPDSPFLGEGRELLVAEFGKEYGIYFSILQLIAAGKNSQSEIDSVIGKNTGSYLANLEKDYALITKNKPVFSKPESRNTKYKIGDQYLRFWFRFIYPHESLVETGRTDLLREFVIKGYEQYSGSVLEDYFRDRIAREDRVTTVGNYWDRKGENEIDIIALNDLDGTALVAEVKRNPRKLNLTQLELKAEKIHGLGNYKIEFRGLSLADM
ncbi:MAG: ATP-binding protein [Treponema sp.]|jgi:AAA+ ATPase superfamily predicted ATPase|nr:ATP-binding protein [Treponema sp.]